MRNLKSLLVAAAIIAGAVAIAVFLVSLAPEPVSRDLPHRDPFVTTVPAISGADTIVVHAAGTVRPSAEIALAPQVGGRIDWVDPAFQSGGHFLKGQRLFQIEQETYDYLLRQAEATLAQRQAELLQAEEEAGIARIEYEQYVTRQSNPESVADAPPLALREPQLRAAQAALDRDTARVADARQDLSRTRVVAPFDGFVREESVEVGKYVSPGEPVAHLIATESAEVIAPLSGAEAALIPGLWALRPGDADQSVMARVIAEYGSARYAWQGYVDRAEVSLDEQSRTIDVVIRVPDPFSAGVSLDPTPVPVDPPPLLFGTFVEIEIQGRAAGKHFRVRRAALQPGNEVWAVNDGGTLSIVPVRILQRSNDEVFVTGNLKHGQPLIISGIQYAVEGMTVRIDTAGAQ